MTIKHLFQYTPGRITPVLKDHQYTLPDISQSFKLTNHQDMPDSVTPVMKNHQYTPDGIAPVLKDKQYTPDSITPVLKGHQYTPENFTCLERL